MKGLAVVGAVVCAVVLVTAGAAASTAEVTMPGRFYAPREIDVLVDTSVTWQNTDSATHTVTEDDDEFDSGHIRPGGSFSETFTEPGTYAFHCTIHRFMRGAVHVFEVVLRGPPDPLSAGRRALLAGVAPPGVETVTLVRITPGPAVPVGQATPAVDGAFSFVVRAPEPRGYRVRAGSATSPLVRVRVAPRVMIERRAGGVAVRALPARPGSRAVLQVYDRERFSFATVARGRLDESSRTTFPYLPHDAQHVRVVVLAQDGWSAGSSRAILVRPG